MGSGFLGFLLGQCAYLFHSIVQTLFLVTVFNTVRIYLERRLHVFP